MLFDADVTASCTGSRLDGVDTAADHLSHAIALEPRFWPALVEKARLWAAVGDWEQVRTAVIADREAPRRPAVAVLIDLQLLATDASCLPSNARFALKLRVRPFSACRLNLYARTKLELVFGFLA